VLHGTGVTTTHYRNGRFLLRASSRVS